MSEVVEWYQRVDVGKKKLIHTINGRHAIVTLNTSLNILAFHQPFKVIILSAVSLRLETCTSLEAAVASVNSVRSEKSYCYVH